LSNAVKFTVHGEISASAGTAPLGGGRTRVTIAVKDTGIGLDVEQQAGLFEPLLKPAAEPSGSTRTPSSGIVTRVLVVDDHPVNAMTVILTGRGDDRQ
jgi:signal transduction histidine kinase